MTTRYLKDIKKIALYIFIMYNRGMSNSRESLKHILTTEPQRQLKYSIESLTNHDIKHHAQLRMLFDQMREASKKQRKNKKTEFPQELKTYRKLTSRVQFFMRMFTEKGEGYNYKNPDTLHQAAYLIGHDLGTIKDIYKANTQDVHIDLAELEQRVIDTRISFTEDDEKMVEISTIHSRINELREFITRMSSADSVLLSDMHDLRKQLRGISYSVELRLVFSPDSNLTDLDSELRNLVHELGDFHDIYVNKFTKQAPKKTEFDQIYAATVIVLPDKIKKLLVDLLQIF